MTEGNGARSVSEGFRLSTVADVGRIHDAGLRAASAVVEQVLALSRQVTEARIPTTARLGPLDGSGSGRSGPEGSAGDAGATRARDLRALRADAERLIELYGDWTRALVDGVAALADATPTTPVDVLRLGPVAAGGEVTGSVWLHTFEGPVAAPAPLHATDLVSHARAVITGGSLVFDPGALDTLRTFDSREIRIGGRVPADAPPGTYRGWLLAEGLPEVALPVWLEVG